MSDTLLTLDRELQEKILARVKKNDAGCWLWQGRLNEGYGSLSYRGRSQGVHRHSYEAFVGPIPEGLTIDHLCRVRNCVNPRHLEPVTGRENTLRGMSMVARNARKTRCKNGHEFTEENTDPRRGGRTRACRECRRESNRRTQRVRRLAGVLVVHCSECLWRGRRWVSELGKQEKPCPRCGGDVVV